MALFRNVWKTKLNGGNPPGSELSVVREDRKAEILFSLVETQGHVKRRLTFTLNAHQALELARFLAGISTVFASPEAVLDDTEAMEDFREEPTKPISVPAETKGSIPEPNDPKPE